MIPLSIYTKKGKINSYHYKQQLFWPVSQISALCMISRGWMVTDYMQKYLYTSVNISVYHGPPRTERIFLISNVYFSKHLEQFCSTLLLYTATMVQTSRMPHFSFWNEWYKYSILTNPSAVVTWISDKISRDL